MISTGLAIFPIAEALSCINYNYMSIHLQSLFFFSVSEARVVFYAFVTTIFLSMLDNRKNTLVVQLIMSIKSNKLFTYSSTCYSSILLI